MSQEVMTAKELAKYLSVAPGTIYKKVERREIPFTKVGSLLRFPKWLIDRWLTEHADQPTPNLYDQFVRLQQRYHLEQFLKGRGLDPASLSETQMSQELTRAVAEAYEGPQDGEDP